MHGEGSCSKDRGSSGKSNCCTLSWGGSFPSSTCDLSVVEIQCRSAICLPDLASAMGALCLASHAGSNLKPQPRIPPTYPKRLGRWGRGRAPGNGVICLCVFNSHCQHLKFTSTSGPRTGNSCNKSKIGLVTEIGLKLAKELVKQWKRAKFTNGSMSLGHIAGGQSKPTCPLAFACRSTKKRHMSNGIFVRTTTRLARASPPEQATLQIAGLRRLIALKYRVLSFLGFAGLIAPKLLRIPGCLMGFIACQRTP